MKNDTTTDCPLCKGKSSVFHQQKKQLYHQCNDCYGIFIDRNYLLSKEAEYSRYQKHNNDVTDVGYQKFVAPITSAIMKDFSKSHSGLDFGAGNGPVISEILLNNGYKIQKYDPYFNNNLNLLTKKYDYIACCEVIEHFYTPKVEFKLLKELLLPKGKMYCMTSIYNETIKFHTWEYKTDPTHVFFYHQKTINLIKEKFDFSNVIINGRLITFSN